jgi:hypothetical protein
MERTLDRIDDDGRAAIRRGAAIGRRAATIRRGKEVANA